MWYELYVYEIGDSSLRSEWRISPVGFFESRSREPISEWRNNTSYVKRAVKYCCLTKHKPWSFAFLYCLFLSHAPVLLMLPPPPKCQSFYPVFLYFLLIFSPFNAFFLIFLLFFPIILVLVYILSSLFAIIFIHFILFTFYFFLIFRFFSFTYPFWIKLSIFTITLYKLLLGVFVTFFV